MGFWCFLVFFHEKSIFYIFIISATFCERKSWLKRTKNGKTQKKRENRQQNTFFDIQILDRMANSIHNDILPTPLEQKNYKKIRFCEFYGYKTLLQIENMQNQQNFEKNAKKTQKKALHPKKVHKFRPNLKKSTSMGK